MLTAGQPAAHDHDEHLRCHLVDDVPGARALCGAPVGDHGTCHGVGFGPVCDGCGLRNCARCLAIAEAEDTVYTAAERFA